MFTRVIIGTTIASAIVLAWLLTATSPTDAGPLGVLAVFLCVYIACVGVITFVIRYGSIVSTRIGRSVHLLRAAEPLSMRHSYYYSTVVAMVPVLLLGLQSVGGVTVYEVMLVLLFVTIGIIYITKRL